MKKRLLAIFLAVLMLASLLPTSVFAADGDRVQIVHSDGTTTGFAGLDKALQAIQAGETIKLLTNISRNSALSVSGKTFTLDLNGYTLTTTANIVISAGADVVIDATGGGGITSSSAARLFQVQDGASLTINGGTFTGGTNLFVNNMGAVTINAGTFPTSSYGNAFINGTGTTNIYGGTFSATKLENGNGSVNVIGGTFATNVSSYASAPYTVYDGSTYTYCADYDAAYAEYVAVRGNSGSWLASTTASGDAVAVTLDDGNGGSETISVLPGTTIVLPTPAERNNYTFEGWTAESSNEVIEAGTGVEVNSAVTYTAQWSGYGANVSFKDFDAKGANNTVDVSIGETIYIRGTDGADKDEVVNGNYTLNDVYKSGYTFLGWDYTTDEYGGDVFTARWAKDVTINAVYGESTQVTENVGEQVGAVSGSYVDVTYTSSGNITIASKDTLSVGGDYNEVVILTNKDTGEFAAAFNVTVVVTSAEQGPWFESASIEVLVNGTGTNALVGVSGNATVTYSSSDTTVATVDENTGVVTGVSAGTATITATISATDNYQAATRTYTVTVNPQTYTVTFDGNGNDGGIVPVARTGVTDGSTITEPINEPTRTGYTFIGWSATNSAEDIWDFDTDTVTGPTTLYAVWAENAHTVTFDTDGGTEVESQTVLDEGLVEQPDDPTKTGYTFNGWLYSLTGSDTNIATWDFAASRVQADITLHAQWTPNSYDVTYHGNGGTRANGEDTFTAQATYDASYTVRGMNLFTYEGYTLLGWATEEGSDEIVYTPGQVIDAWNIAEPIDLYAVWSMDVWTVTFQAGDGAYFYYDEDENPVTEIEISVPKGSTIPAESIPVPVKPGYSYTWMISGYEQEANFANPVNENLTIYAEYTAETYHVTYVFNDGSREDFEYSVDYHYGDRIDYVESFETEETAYKGHTLVGWFKDEELTDQWNFETDTITGNLTLYAKWELNDQTVTYTSYNGMDNDPVEGVTRTYKYGDVIYLDYNDGTALSELEIDGDKMLSDQTRDGYTFMGWYVEDDGCTFTAQWKEITYTVTFGPNGGSFEEGVSSTLEVAYSDGQITEEETPVPSMDGYTFAGWYTGPADDAAIYDYSTSISDSFTLYAHWTQTTYTVTYIGNGGEATIDGLDGYTEYTQTIYDTKGQSFIPNLFEREGYTFIGWTLKEDGSGSLFADEKAISNPRNMTLYAQWDANEYTVVFDANGGNIVGGGAAETTVLDFGETLNIPTPEKDGYTFTGWFYTDETTLSVYEAGTEVEYKEPYNLTLLAGWAPNSYYITFDAGEGVIKDSNGENSVQYHITYDGSYTVPVAERTGYEFKGWYDDDENLVYEGGETTTLTIAEDCTLTAGWEQERYSVTFVSDDVSRTRANAYTYGQTIPEPFSFSKDGYTLEGWYTQPDGGGDKWDFATSAIISDLTLYANWEPIVYTVSYDAWAGDGNEPTDGEQKFYYNEVITIDPNGGIYDGSAEVAIQADYTLDEPTRNNYTFTGWYFDSSSYTFTAQWTEVTYTVTFIGNGGEATIEDVPGYTEYTQTLYADQTGQKLIANLFEREGYTFTGWSTKQEGGTLWSDGRTISSPRNLTLYAQWEVSEYTVTFHGKGGYTSYNSTTYTETVTHGYVLSLPAYDLFTRQGYVFLGWSDEPNTEIDYEVGTATIPVSGETHLYAVWAQVVDFGNIEYGTTSVETIQYSDSIDNVTRESNNFNAATDDSDASKLELNPRAALTPGSYTELITVTLENGETHYIQAMVNVTLGDITVGIVDPKDFYVVDDEITVYVEAAPNQSLTLEVTGNTGGALEEIMGLTEDAENPGHYYATYKVTSIPEDELSLTFNVWLGENVVATNTEAVALRTVLYVTMTESDGGAIGPDSLAITLKDANDTSRSQTFSYDTEGGRYYTFVDKSGWDYIQIDANDGRSLTLWYTTMIPEQMLADALLGDYGIVNASYQFAGYTVEATLSINGEPVDNVSYTLTGNYGADINFNALIVWAADQASYLYGNPQTDRYNTTITNMAGETLTSGKYGEENSLMTWGENNTLQVNIDITVEYKVAFMYNGSTDDTLEVAAVYVKPGETVEAPETAPARTGYTFSGWYTDAACTQEYNFDTPVTDNLNLYAKWTINTYTVQFHNGYEGIYPDGTDWEAQEIVYLGTVSPVPEPEREGYKFLGWFKADGTQWDFSDYQVTEDTTLYAHWEQLSYQLTYDLHPGSGAVTNAEEFTDGTVYYGDTIQEPENDPILEGYVFQGWYLDASYENEAQFPITVTGDVTLHAKWAEAVTVTFILNDGTDNYYTVQVAKGSAIPEQTNPTLDGYEFVGWFAEDGKWTTTWDFNTIIEEPVTLTAGWETLTGLATFFNKTSTSTYVRIQLTHIDGSVTPANGITDLTLTAKSSDGNTTYFTGVTMTEITEGDDAWQSDWDAGQYAYYYASHPSLAGKSGTLSLTAEGYTFTSISSSSD